MKNFFVFLLLCGLLTACGTAEEIPEETGIAAETDEIVQEPAETPVTDAAEEPAEPTETVYVSLGDSIARGYGLADVRNEVYSAVLAGSFEESGRTMVPYNFGVDGQDSTQLAAYIVNNPAIPEALADADYVSISIGANNFLGEAFDFLEICYDFQKNPSTRLTADDVTAAYQQFNRDVAAGVDRLREDIPEIIGNIRASNEDCGILFLTCYNPYGAVDVTLDWGGAMPVNFAALAGTSVTQMNDVIRDLADDYGYTVADVYSAFEGKWDRLVNAAPVESGGSLDMNAVDPHPNKNGHAVIADVLTGLME